MKKIKVFLVDDHTIMREGLRSLISTNSNIEVVGEAGEVFELLDKLKICKPDIVVLDISLPGVSGLDAIRKIFRINPKTKIIILSMYSDREIVQKSLRLGARGYLVKKNAAKDLISAIEAVSRGEVYLSSIVSKDIVENYIKIADYSAKKTPFDNLTLREKQIFGFLAQGEPNKLIAEKLNISIRTVEAHRYNIMRKLGVKNIAELVKLAIKIGVV